MPTACLGRPPGPLDIEIKTGLELGVVEIRKARGRNRAFVLILARPPAMMIAKFHCASPAPSHPSVSRNGGIAGDAPLDQQ